MSLSIFPRRLVTFFTSLARIDLSNGVYKLSSPEENTLSLDSNLAITTTSSSTSLLLDSEVMLPANGNPSSSSPFYSRVQQKLYKKITSMGKTSVQKIPDNFLLGLLVLISIELIKRELVLKQSYPLAVREVAQRTILELERKLEHLSNTDWQLDPFIAAEFKRLRAQPIEVIDKYLVTGSALIICSYHSYLLLHIYSPEVLPNLDKELSPYFNRLTGDPNHVTLFVKDIKELIQLISLILLRLDDKSNSLSRTTDMLIQSIDQVGSKIEDGMFSS